MMKCLSLLLLLPILIVKTSSAQISDPTPDTLSKIAAELDKILFVNRFETVETPCFYLSPDCSKTASHGKKKVINSNYRIQVIQKDSIIDNSGVKCLSEYCSRYMKFQVDSVKTDSLMIKGKVKSTYAYPSSTIIQYLGLSEKDNAENEAFFKKLYYGEGVFWLYSEDNTYKMRIVLQTGPYNEKDTMYGHLEVVRGLRSNEKSYNIYFSEMSVDKGDHNNQISLRFSSTNHRWETIYHVQMIVNVLKKAEKGNKLEQANGVWLTNFLTDPACVTCGVVYKMALDQLKLKQLKTLPNTEPLPPLR